MPIADIPVYEAGASTEIAGLGQMSIGAQMAITAGVALATTGISSLVQMKMARDERKYQEGLAQQQQARADELQRRADEEKAKMEQEMRAAAAVEQEKAAKAEGIKKTFVVTGGIIAGVGVLALALGYFVFRD